MIKRILISAAFMLAAMLPVRAQDVPTVAIQNFLVSHTGVSDDTAYKIVDAIYAREREIFC